MSLADWTDIILGSILLTVITTAIYAMAALFRHGKQHDKLMADWREAINKHDWTRSHYYKKEADRMHGFFDSFIFPHWSEYNYRPYPEDKLKVVK